MGYTIIYGRQFIRTNRGIIPLILAGANNATMFIWNREIRERDWEPFFCVGNKVELFEDEIAATVEKQYGGSNLDKEIYARISGQKGMATGKSLYNYFIGGIKNALTLEEIRQIQPWQSLSCCLGYYANTGEKGCSEYHSELQARGIKTTETLEKWIDEATQRANELSVQGISAALHLEFLGYKPLNIDKAARSRKLQGPVVVKIKSGYVCRVTEHGISTALGENGILKALVFDSVEDAISKLPPPSRSRTYLFEATSSIEKAKNAYVICVTKGIRAGEYLLKKTKNYFFFTFDEEQAKRFRTEAAAKRWATSYLFENPYIEAYEIKPLKKEGETK